MFRRKVQGIRDLLNKTLRQEGLETPLKQHRLLDAWDTVAGPIVARYTTEKFIRNQTLFVKIINPAVRADLSMRRTALVHQLNDLVHGQIITEIKLY
ncbi:MAG: DUF721 domain-containing protein [Prevotellaceae bacterium]|nr:DUF721 domain-containing protein [Prevotellaceae bacterium]